MSQKFPGGFVTKSPVAPTTSAASGIWTLDQQEQYQKAGTWPSPPPPPYIEDVFSTYLYTGNGSTQTITNGIDLSTKGGLIWTKCRNNAANNALFDTARGTTKYLSSNLTNAQATEANGVTAFNSTGYTFGNNYDLNENTFTYASWTFRKQPKFFDVVTYTGNGSAQNISHNLGSVPGCIIIKTTATSDVWRVYHRSIGNQYVLALDQTLAQIGPSAAHWNNTDPTSTEFTVGTNGSLSGQPYVAYLFAHDAGGFGATETDNVISCGSYTGNGSTSGPAVNLGYEPQWVMIKKSSAEESWYIYDSMRGVVTGAVSQADRKLRANSSGIEGGLVANDPINFGATGFNIGTTDNELNNSGDTYIYIAIRRGPMKVPTSGTQVYATDTRNGTAPNPPTFNSGFPVDWALSRDVSQTWDWVVSQRLLGNYGFDGISTVAATDLGGDWGAFDFMDGFNTLGTVNANYRSWMFRRYPNVFDVVCYTGTGSALNVTHNLSAVPSFLIVKRRNTTGGWIALHQEGYAGSWGFRRLDNDTSFLNAVSYPTYFGNGSSFVAPTSTQFTVGSNADLNASGGTYVAYLFATCAGVSKVGSYTGTGATQTISCGFTGGARFVLIKRTDSTGNWYVWDTARGMVSGTDPYLLLNSTAAEVNTNSVYTTTDGFQIISTASGINASGGSYIFLAIA